MALQRAFILTSWAIDEGVNVPKALVDWPHVLGSVTGYDLTGRYRWVEVAVDDVQFLPEARPVRLVTTEGIRQFADRVGGQSIPPSPNVHMIEVVADETVIDAIRAAVIAATPKTGFALPAWATYVGEGVTSFEPDDPYTQAEVGHIQTWLNAHGITTGAFLNYFEMTGPEVVAWMKSHPRQQFTNILAREWAELQGA